MINDSLPKYELSQEPLDVFVTRIENAQAERDFLKSQPGYRPKYQIIPAKKPTENRAQFRARMKRERRTKVNKP